MTRSRISFTPSSDFESSYGRNGTEKKKKKNLHEGTLDPNSQLYPPIRPTQRYLRPRPVTTIQRDHPTPLSYQPQCHPQNVHQLRQTEYGELGDKGGDPERRSTTEGGGRVDGPYKREEERRKGSGRLGDSRSGDTTVVLVGKYRRQQSAMSDNYRLRRSRVWRHIPNTKVSVTHERRGDRGG